MQNSTEKLEKLTKLNSVFELAKAGSILEEQINLDKHFVKKLEIELKYLYKYQEPQKENLNFILKIYEITSKYNITPKIYDILYKAMKNKIFYRSENYKELKIEIAQNYITLYETILKQSDKTKENIINSINCYEMYEISKGSYAEFINTMFSLAIACKSNVKLTRIFDEKLKEVSYFKNFLTNEQKKSFDLNKKKKDLVCTTINVIKSDIKSKKYSCNEQQIIDRFIILLNEWNE